MRLWKFSALLLAVIIAAGVQAAPVARQRFDDNWSFKLSSAPGFTGVGIGHGLMAVGGPTARLEHRRTDRGDESQRRAGRLFPDGGGLVSQGP